MHDSGAARSLFWNNGGMDLVLSSTTLGRAAPERLVYVLHGALGAGHNLRSFVRKLAEARPSFGFVLVDLRHHGASQGMAGPNTLANAAHDLTLLAKQLGRAPDCLIGHSLGGKVALQYAVTEAQALDQLWMLDSYPGTQALGTNHEVLEVMAAMHAVKLPAPSRQHVVTELVQNGMSQGTANWLSSNLKTTDSGFVWSLDFDAIRELVEDYARVDLWPFLAEPHATDIRLVIAERSRLWNEHSRARAQALPQAANVHVHLLADAGHWLHVDNPEGLLQLMSASFVGSERAPG